jgi:hypothetical protein
MHPWPLHAHIKVEWHLLCTSWYRAEKLRFGKEELDVDHVIRLGYRLPGWGNTQETDHANRIHRRGRSCIAHLRQCGHDLSTSAPVPNMPDPTPNGGGDGTRPGALWRGDSHVL